MELKSVPAAWDSEDAAVWSQFLTATRAGQRLFPRLLSVAPALLDGADVNKTLVRNGELRGFQSALRELIVIQGNEPQPQRDPISDAYPSLDDDSKWTDVESAPTPKE